ncbi:SLAIN motif-containing protein 2-like [Macrobrachium nipponense]|uniref:SLAIN motif-containing protein 2-like n=1 Tax=Macrobrachium nipponense TaxID=159736 RepID=UPI0030C7BB85
MRGGIKMSLIMDNRLEETADTEAEVKKLQALVKQLELQNEELRSERQQLMKEGGGSVGGSPVPMGDGTTTPVGGKDHSQQPPTTPKRQSQGLDSDFEAMDPIGLDETDLSDDETWLFESPSPQAKPHNSDWLRKDVDDPSLIVAKKSLYKN